MNELKATRSLRRAAFLLLAADEDTLAQAADANKVALVKTNFSPSESLGIGDLTLADFQGSTPKLAGLEEQPEGEDPATGDSLITIKAPAGGWRFETTGTDNLPQTIYGAVLMNNDGDELFASVLLDEPVLLNDVNQVIDLGALVLRQQAGSM